MKKVGRYLVVSELGRGAMGIVYKASDPTIDREVALKVLSLNASREEGTNSPQEMFMREVRAAGRLAHPSIVTIHDAFDDPENQTSCIVMELVPGRTLEKTLESGPPLSTDQLLSIIRQVTEALDYAHRHNVIHRDLKPANILVTEDGRAKITDFGIAKVLAREGIARTVGIMGTPSFMSPEQVRGGEIDARTDIFSLGIILFTMLTGQKPFSGNPAAVMFKIVYEEPPVPSSLNPLLSPDFDHVIKKCLAKDRNLRYSSARELLGDLDDLQHGRPLRSLAAASTPAPAQPASAGPDPRWEHTLELPIPGHVRGAPKPPPQPVPPSVSAAPPAKLSALQPEPPTDRVSAASNSRTVTSVSEPSSADIAPSAPPGAEQAPGRNTQWPGGVPTNPAVIPGKTVMMQVPDLSEASSPKVPSPPANPPPSGSPEAFDIEPTARIPSSSYSAPPAQFTTSPQPQSPPSAQGGSPLAKTAPIPEPGVFVGASAGGPHSPDLATPADVEATPAALPVSKPKFVPISIGGLAVILLAAGVVGYRKFHQAKAVPAPSPRAAVQRLPLNPPAVPPPVEATPPIATPEEPPAPIAQPEVATKPIQRHPRQPAVAHPSAPAPGPAPPTPQPVVTPAPAPAPVTPSPDDIAKAEAAKLGNAPRVVQIVCNYAFKEATFTFSSGGRTLYEDTSKGKKKKAGFLGIKGSYEGSFSHSITVPAGASDVSLHIVSGDGTTDLNRAIKMLPPGGFVPTLIVKADSANVALSWKSSSVGK